MTPIEALREACAILGPPFRHPRAERAVMAIGLQESRFEHRVQMGPDYYLPHLARGFWQFERNGGVKGVLNHPATHSPARLLCEARRIWPVTSDVHDALAWDDVLAAGMARLLLYSLPDPLPITAEDGWRQYCAAWRPGKPHPETWPGNWSRAAEACRS